MSVMVLCLLLLVALLVAAVALMWRAFGANDDGVAQRTLAQRYARGEIDDDEFQRRQERLRGGRPQP